MITSININNANLYSALYSEVSKELNELIENKGRPYFEKTQTEIAAMDKGYERICSILVSDQKEDNPKYDLCWDKEGKISINSLEAYYGIIEDLVEEKPKYGILPLDEPPFIIDANSRTIRIPEGFTGVQVQGDHRAEIIYFQINRYFDITDLADESLAAYIQWERPDGQKGYSIPCIKDVDSKPGYILLGWVLSSSITACSGNVKFSVRFVSKNPTTSEINFSLTTLNSFLEIKNGLVLNFKDDDNLIMEISGARFKNGAMNGSSEAIAPSIGRINFNKDDYYFFVSNKNNDNFKIDKLKITAVSPDAGSLSYGWRTDEMEESDEDKEGEVEIIEHTIIKDTTVTPTEFTIKDKDGFEVEKKISSLETFIDKYQCYKEKDGNIPTGLIDSVDDIVFDDNEAIVYIPFNTYTVDSVGNYYCIIYNKVGLRTSETQSDKAHYPGPVNPITAQKTTIREGLKMGGDDGTEVVTKLVDPTTCDSSTNEAIKERLEYVYKWYYSENGSTYGTDVYSTEKSITPNAAGFYKSVVKSKLNNVESATAVENVWNVVTAPKPSLLINNTSVVESATPIYMTPGQTAQIKISNMLNYDTVYYKVEAINRSTGDVSRTVTEGSIPYMDVGLNAMVTDYFNFITQSDMCKITCIGQVGSSYIIDSESFVFYTEASTTS